MELTPPFYPLKGFIQNYDWGGKNYISELLNKPNAEQVPEAELWLGDHPKGPAKATTEHGSVPLTELVRRHSKEILGPEVANRFNHRLPFLFKVLDVNKMLSIQAHPSKEEAERGFELEEQAGIPVTAFHRNFRDNNHKPEIMVALTPFWLLHGFLPMDQIKVNFRRVKSWSALSDSIEKLTLRQAYQLIMEMPQSQVNKLLSGLQQELNGQSFTKNQPEYWAGIALQDYTSPDGHYDRGVFSIYMMNIVELAAGEGIFQEAGIMHAYLEGVNIELMANSDNVFRGGLTPKHVDVDQLLKHLKFIPVEPEILKGEAENRFEKHYPAPVEDFLLSAVELPGGETFTSKSAVGPRIFLILEGEITVQNQETLRKGDSFLVPNGKSPRLKAEKPSRLFRASLPHFS